MAITMNTTEWSSTGSYGDNTSLIGVGGYTYSVTLNGYGVTAVTGTNTTNINEAIANISRYTHDHSRNYSYSYGSCTCNCNDNCDDS